MALTSLPPADLEFVNSVVSKSAGDVMVRQLEVSIETTKEGTVFKKAKSVKVPRVLVVTQFKLYLFDATGRSLKEKRYVDAWLLDIFAIEVSDGGKAMNIKSRVNRTVQELEFTCDTVDLQEIATLIRQSKHDQAPDWPEVALVGQPSIFPVPSGASTFDTFRTTYNSLCVYHGMQPSAAALVYVENLHWAGNRDFAVHDIPGADWHSVGEKDALLGTAGLIPILHALRYDRYFLGLSAFNILRRELVISLAQVLRTNCTLTKLQLCNNDADSSSLTELALAMKENRNLRLQRIEISDHKNLDHRTTHVLSSLLTTYPLPRLSHLSLARCALPGKGLTKLFQAFQMNYSISLGISHLNLSGAKFDSETVAALELWLELGGNYSHLEELVLSDVSNLPFKVLPKFKACTKLNKLVLANNKLDSSSDMKQVAQLIVEAPALRRLNFSSCGIERGTILDALMEAVKKMKCDEIELNLSNNSAAATESHWISILKECKIKALHLTNIHFTNSVIESLFNCFKSFPALKTLALDDCKTKLRGSDFALALVQCPALETLSVANAFDDASTFRLLDGIITSNKTINNLDISFNNLGDDLGNYLVKLIHQNPHITRLNCDGNGMSYTCWHGISEALRSATAVTHTVQYPHSDVAALMSWATTLPRQSALSKQLLNMHELLRSITITDENGKEEHGCLSTVDLSVAEKWESPAEALSAAPIPSHLASQHTEMKLEDLGEWTVPALTTPPPDYASSPLSPGSSTAAASSDVTSPPSSRVSSVRASVSYSMRRPSAADIFPVQSINGSPGRISPSSSSTSVSSPNGNGLSVSGTNSSSSSPPPSPRSASMSVSYGSKPPVGTPPKVPMKLPPGVGSSPHTRSASVAPRPTPGSSDGRPLTQPPPLPGSLPAHLRGVSVSGSPPGNPSIDDFGLSPRSPLTFGSYGQVDEEIDAEEPVRRATLNEMVIRLAHESSSDVKFMHTFLLTYRATVEPAELLDRLITRFFSKPPKGADVKTWFETTLRPIRLRVMNVLKRWSEAHWQDFANDSGLIASLEAFLKDPTVNRYHESPASALLSFIQKQSQISPQKVIMTGTMRGRFDPDAVEMSPRLAADDQGSGMIGVLSKYSAEEIADQMCLLENDLFQSLQSKEFFNQGWNKGTNEQKDAAAPNIRLMIRVSNQITTWVAYEVLRQPTASARSKALSKVITLAQCLMDRNNFNGLKEVTAGLALSSVQRLKKAWVGVKPKLKQTYTDLSSSVDNMQSMRKLAHQAMPPLIPYLGVYLTDLVFIEDGNPNTFEEDGSTFINFRKMSILGEVLMEISSYQQERYVIPKIEELYYYLLTLDARPDNELHQLSIAAEPKKK